MKDNPALVMITTSFPVSGDGSEAAGAFVADLAKEISQSMPVRVVAPGRQQAREVWSEQLQVFRYKSPEKPLSTLKLWNLLDALLALAVLRNGLEAARAATRHGCTAHVLSLWALPCGYWGRIAAGEAGCAYSVWTLGSDIWSLGRIPLVRQYMRKVLRGARACFSDGLKLATDTEEVSGVPAIFLPSTRRILSRRERPLRDAPPYRLLFLGRWHPNKGVDLLLDALARLPSEDWALVAEVSVCGGGPLAGVVEARVKRLQADTRPVKLRGYLNASEAEQEIISSDYLLIPSRIESIPLVFSDAVKLRSVVVSTPVGDLPSLIESDPPAGMVSLEVSAASFSEAMSKALRTPPSAYLEGLDSAAAEFDIGEIAARLVRLAAPTHKIAPDSRSQAGARHVS